MIYRGDVRRTCVLVVCGRRGERQYNGCQNHSDRESKAPPPFRPAELGHRVIFSRVALSYRTRAPLITNSNLYYRDHHNRHQRKYQNENVFQT